MTEQVRFEILQAFKKCNLKALVTEIKQSLKGYGCTFLVYDTLFNTIDVIREEINAFSIGVIYLIYFSEEDAEIVLDKIQEYILQLKLTS